MYILSNAFLRTLLLNLHINPYCVWRCCKDGCSDKYDECGDLEEHVWEELVIILLLAMKKLCSRNMTCVVRSILKYVDFQCVINKLIDELHTCSSTITRFFVDHTNIKNWVKCGHSECMTRISPTFVLENSTRLPVVFECIRYDSVNCPGPYNIYCCRRCITRELCNCLLVDSNVPTDWCNICNNTCCPLCYVGCTCPDYY